MLKAALDLCGFQPGERFALAAIRDRQITPEVFDSVDAAEAWLAGRDGWNCYLTGNPIREGVTGRPKAGDVAECRVLLFDCDPKPDGDTLSVATAVAQETGGALVFSGRGHQVWIRVAEGLDRKRALGWLRERYSAPGVAIDGTHDPSRLMRLPGTVNLKTGAVASVLNPGTGEVWDPVLPAAAVAEKPQGMSANMADLWDNPGGDRSKRDARFLLEGLKAGLPETRVRELLYQLPGGKAQEDERGEDYWESTLSWARERVTELDKARSIVDAAEDDPGAPFASWALRVLASVKQHDKEEWQRLRRQLKKARIPIRDLESALPKPDMGPAPIRNTRDLNGKALGWWLQANGSGWVCHPRTDVVTWLQDMGFDTGHSLRVAIDHIWTMVSEPFQPEELEGNRWNRNAAQFRVKPEPGDHPTWDQMLEVLFRELDPYAKAAGFRSGSHYALCWLAAMVQKPKARTPYLFLFSREQGVGKSMLHEAVTQCLLDGGSVNAKQALLSQGGFNGELQGAVLCYADELDLGKARGSSYERIKEWSTGEDLPVHVKGCTPYVVPNTTRWIHTANNPSFCPVFAGDSRVTVVLCRPYGEDERSTKAEMLKAMGAEAAAFLRTLLNVPLDGLGDGRLAVRVLETPWKAQQQHAHLSDLERWCEDTPTWVAMTDAELVSAFRDTVDVSELRYWSRPRILRELPAGRAEDRDLALRLRRLGDWSGTTSELASRVAWTGDSRTLGLGLRRLESAGFTTDRKRVKAGTWWHVVFRGVDVMQPNMQP